MVIKYSNEFCVFDTQSLIYQTKIAALGFGLVGIVIRPELDLDRLSKVSRRVRHKCCWAKKTNTEGLSPTALLFQFMHIFIKVNVILIGGVSKTQVGVDGGGGRGAS